MVSKLQRHHSLIVKMSKSCHHEVPLLLQHLLYRLQLHWTDSYCNQLWKSYPKCHWHWSMFQRCLMRMTRLTQSQHHETLHGFVTLMTFECWLLLHELVVSCLLPLTSLRIACPLCLITNQHIFLKRMQVAGYSSRCLYGTNAQLCGCSGE